jgi:hypothetical protein
MEDWRVTTIDTEILIKVQESAQVVEKQGDYDCHPEPVKVTRSGTL